MSRPTVASLRAAAAREQEGRERASLRSANAALRLQDAEERANPALAAAREEAYALRDRLARADDAVDRALRAADPDTLPPDVRAALEAFNATKAAWLAAMGKVRALEAK